MSWRARRVGSRRRGRRRAPWEASASCGTDSTRNRSAGTPSTIAGAEATQLVDGAGAARQERP